MCLDKKQAMREVWYRTCSLASSEVSALMKIRSSTSTTTAPTATTTDVLTGTVAAPINGVLQSSSNPSSVGQSRGTVSVTLTSAVETLQAALS